MRDNLVREALRRTPIRPTIPSVSRSLAALLDIVAVAVFVAIGLSVHTAGVTLSGMASVSWPFLTGAAIGWLGARRSPWTVWPSGIVVWLSTVAVGMFLRVVASQGIAAAFVVVALLFLGAEMLGWRLVAQVVSRASRGTGKARAASSAGRKA